MEIHIKMIEAMRQIEAVKKERTMTGGPAFKYRGIDDIMDEVAPILRKVGIGVLPKSINYKLETKLFEKFNASGAVIGKRDDVRVTLAMSYTFFAEDGSFVEAGPFDGEGIDSQDKATSKAQTNALKAAYSQIFVIPVREMGELEFDPLSYNREMPDIAKSKPLTKEEVLTNEQIIKNIKDELGRLTEGKEKTEKAKFMFEKIKVGSFSELTKKTNEELSLIYQSLAISDVTF